MNFYNPYSGIYNYQLYPYSNQSTEVDQLAYRQHQAGTHHHIPQHHVQHHTHQHTHHHTHHHHHHTGTTGHTTHTTHTGHREY